MMTVWTTFVRVTIVVIAREIASRTIAASLSLWWRDDQPILVLAVAQAVRGWLRNKRGVYTENHRCGPRIRRSAMHPREGQMPQP